MSDVRDPERDQQLPEPSASVPIAILVQMDIAERMVHGHQKYGTPLQAGNGRNALQDAYEEILDAACYLKQALVEQNSAGILYIPGPEVSRNLCEEPRFNPRIDHITEKEN